MKWGDRSQGELTLPVGRWVDNAKALDAGKRVSVGKDRPLFKQGKCMICEIPLAGYEDKDRDVCGAVYCGAQAASRKGTELP